MSGHRSHMPSITEDQKSFVRYDGEASNLNKSVRFKKLVEVVGQVCWRSRQPDLVMKFKKTAYLSDDWDRSIVSLRQAERFHSKSAGAMRNAQRALAP